ncbi:MAG: sulfatase [Henriciella sp.]|nr:sulfatase [Henriciella sp.]
MLKRVLITLIVLIVAGIGLAWLNRTSILLHLVERQKVPVAPHQAIAWAKGPDTATLPATERPPNIIFILLDDVGINDISTYGGGVAEGRVPTPHIDQLAADGANFLQAYAGTGTCAPSRAMLLTGRYPTRTGFEYTPTPDGMGRAVAMIGNQMQSEHLPPIVFDSDRDAAAPPYEEKGLPSEEVTIAEVLKARGYHTAHIGKWHLGRGEGFRPNDQGFDESLLMASGLFLPEDDPNVVNAKLPFDPIDQFLWARMQYAASFNGGEWFEPRGYLTDYWTEESLNLIEANKHRPFFLYLAHWGVHTPLQATKEDYDAVGDIEPHRLRVYAAMLRALDRSVGQIVEKLEQEGLSENTLIVLSSDNGGAGYVGLSDINAPYRGWKITLFEGGIRVPMLVKWPAQITAGTISDTPVAHIDVMPTLASAANAPLPQGVAIDGQNMLTELLGTGEIQRPDDALFWQSGYTKVVRAGDWKLQVDGRQDKRWLFDLAADPTEQNNLAALRPDKLAELQALLDQHAASAREPLYPYTIESAIAIDKTLADPIEPGDEYAWWPN